MESYPDRRKPLSPTALSFLPVATIFFTLSCDGLVKVFQFTSHQKDWYNDTSLTYLSAANTLFPGSSRWGSYFLWTGLTTAAATHRTFHPINSGAFLENGTQQFLFKVLLDALFLSTSTVDYVLETLGDIAHSRICTSEPNLGVHQEWEQHALNTDGTLKDLAEMDWSEPDGSSSSDSEVEVEETQVSNGEIAVALPIKPCCLNLPASLHKRKQPKKVSDETPTTENS
ncbi:hypothetical protein B0H10DRAFT_2193783 [Mycena sp. CBHHK59/15]|nr:hypothetical protein B0H10DRAFT_2193783 [Mycena sp. CBHHK59/15]